MTLLFKWPITVSFTPSILQRIDKSMLTFYLVAQRVTTIREYVPGNIRRLLLGQRNS